MLRRDVAVADSRHGHEAEVDEIDDGCALFGDADRHLETLVM